MSNNAFNKITDQPNTMTNFRSSNNFASDYQKLNINAIDETILNRMASNQIETPNNQNNQQYQTHNIPSPLEFGKHRDNRFFNGISPIPLPNMTILPNQIQHSLDLLAQTDQLTISDYNKKSNILDKTNIISTNDIQDPIAQFQTMSNPHIPYTEHLKPTSLADNFNGTARMDIIKEYITHINSINRDIYKYPNPYNFLTRCAPSSTNSDAYISRTYTNIKYIKIETGVIPRKYFITKNLYTDIAISNGKINDTDITFVKNDNLYDVINNYLIYKIQIDQIPVSNDKFTIVYYGISTSTMDRTTSCVDTVITTASTITIPNSESTSYTYNIIYSLQNQTTNTIIINYCKNQPNYSKSIEKTYEYTINYNIYLEKNKSDLLLKTPIENKTYHNTNQLSIEHIFTSNNITYCINKISELSITYTTFELVKNPMSNNYQLNYTNNLITYIFYTNPNYILTNNTGHQNPIYEYELNDLSFETDRYTVLYLNDINDVSEFSTDMALSKAFNVLYPYIFFGNSLYVDCRYANKIYKYSDLGNLNRLLITLVNSSGKNLTTNLSSQDFNVSTVDSTICTCTIDSNGNNVRDYKCICSYIRHPRYLKIQVEFMFKFGIVETDFDKRAFN
jgi:hypothetical protein